MDPNSTEQVIQSAHAADVAEGEEGIDKKLVIPEEAPKEEPAAEDEGFGEGILDH